MIGPRHRHRGGTALVLTVGLLAATALTSASSTSAATRTSSGNVTGAKHGPLTPRLQQLARPELATASAAAQAAALGVPRAGAGSLIERGGGVLVDIRTSNAAPAVVARLRAAGASITFVDEATGIVTASVAPSRLSAIAAVPQVISVKEVPAPEINAACPTGDTVSEGDTMLTAALARAQHRIDGSGVTVGIISDSYAQTTTVSAATDVVNGELPGAANPCGKLSNVVVQSEGSGGSDEGRAMAQIVHDLAPGATIRMATAFDGEQAFAQQIRDLAAAGAKVIVDDATYFTEPMYQDGVIAQAINDVTAAGVVYFSAAGNSNATLNGSNTNSYETMAYRPTTCPQAVIDEGGYSDCHDFDPGPGEDPTYGATTTTASTFALGWNEPQFGIQTDLDLFLLDHDTGAIVANSFDDSFTTGVAGEWLTNASTLNLDIVVARFQGTHATAGGTPRFKLVDGRAHFTAMEYPVSNGTDVVGPTLFGHSAARSAMTVAAVPYDNANTIETFSSRGPATYCWAGVVGTTPAAALPACVTTTVDFAATDGTQNSFFGAVSDGFHRFYGTSAAAPHAAAVAALLLQQSPCYTAADVIDVLRATARPVGSFDVDAMGAGRIDADAAVAIAASGRFRCFTPTAGSAGGGRTQANTSPSSRASGRSAAPAAPGN